MTRKFLVSFVSTGSNFGFHSCVLAVEGDRLPSLADLVYAKESVVAKGEVIAINSLAVLAVSEIAPN